MEYIVQVKYNTLYENRKIYLPSRFFLDLIWCLQYLYPTQKYWNKDNILFKWNLFSTQNTSEALQLEVFNAYLTFAAILTLDNSSSIFWIVRNYK